jgi:murein DD-endopeptidase MepM/ murein hydrolase activator NlpD
MNIIIVAKPHAAPKSFDLDCWRVRLRVSGLFGLCALITGGVGFLAAMGFANPKDRALSEIHAMRELINVQKAQIGKLEVASRRDLDALALKLGELQAQSTRLNALGERLAQVGKLDDGEFDFSQAPAMGGPEDTTGASHALDSQFSTSIERLRGQFNNQEAQLTVLENMLLDRTVDNALLPSGMPVELGYLGSPYGERADPITGHQEFHAGMDFDAATGTDILAVAEGVVTWDGERPGYGNVVEIDHGNGYMTRYAHNQRNLAKVGERVHLGQAIAKVGSTGRATGPHCHFEVWLNGHTVNPLAYVKSRH